MMKSTPNCITEKNFQPEWRQNEYKVQKQFRAALDRYMAKVDH